MTSSLSYNPMDINETTIHLIRTYTGIDTNYRNLRAQEAAHKSYILASAVFGFIAIPATALLLNTASAIILGAGVVAFTLFHGINESYLPPFDGNKAEESLVKVLRAYTPKQTRLPTEPLNKNLEGWLKVLQGTYCSERIRTLVNQLI